MLQLILQLYEHKIAFPEDDIDNPMDRRVKSCLLSIPDTKIDLHAQSGRNMITIVAQINFDVILPSDDNASARSMDDRQCSNTAVSP